MILRGRRLNDPPWLAVVGWAALAASLGAPVLAALQWSTNYVASPGFSDFKIYYLAARIGESPWISWRLTALEF